MDAISVKPRPGAGASGAPSPASHTPGPWAWAEDGHHLLPVHPDPQSSAVHTILSPEGAYGYIGSDWRQTLAEDQCNRQLMAAAPDMLDALHQAQRALQQLQGAGIAAAVALAKVEAAIVKATGGAA